MCLTRNIHFHSLCMKKQKETKTTNLPFSYVYPLFESQQKQERIDELNQYLEKHRFHIKNLETLMRMLDNSTVEVDQVRKIIE